MSWYRNFWMQVKSVMSSRLVKEADHDRNPVHEHSESVLVKVSIASRDIFYLPSACDTLYSDYVTIMYIHVYILL